VTEAERSRVADGEEASSRLNDSLKSCRSLVASYRAMLTDEPFGAATFGSEQAPDAATDVDIRRPD
jgi:hypothetical protein